MPAVSFCDTGLATTALGFQMTDLTSTDAVLDCLEGLFFVDQRSAPFSFIR